MFKLVVFFDVRGAYLLAGSNLARPYALFTRLETGRLVEVDLAMAEEVVEFTHEFRDHIPVPGSALIVAEDVLPVVEDLLSGQRYEIHDLQRVEPEES